MSQEDIIVSPAEAKSELEEEETSPSDDAEDWWDEDGVNKYCARLKQNDATLNKVYIHEGLYAARITRALMKNTVVEELEVYYQDIPDEAHGRLLDFILNSESLNKFVFYPTDWPVDAGTVIDCKDKTNALRLCNMVISAALSGENPISKLYSFPLCQSTGQEFSLALLMHPKALHKLSLDFVKETKQDRAPIGFLERNLGSDLSRVVKNSHALRVADALKKQSNLEVLSLNWMEEENFAIGRTFLEAISGNLPCSLKTLSMNLFQDKKDEETCCDALVEILKQKSMSLDAICFAHCELESENFRRLIESLEDNTSNLRELEYGYLDSKTAPVFSAAVSTGFASLKKLGVEFANYPEKNVSCEGIEAFEAFCESFYHHSGIECIDILTAFPAEAYKGKPIVETLVSRFYKSVALLINKLPQLKSLSASPKASSFLARSTTIDCPTELIDAVDSHKNLLNMTGLNVVTGKSKVKIHRALHRNRLSHQESKGRGSKSTKANPCKGDRVVLGSLENNEMAPLTKENSQVILELDDFHKPEAAG